MALIVEDGTQVANADSYGSLSGLKTFASRRGNDLASSYTDTQLEAAMIRSMDWIESKRDKFQGDKVSTAQALQWPRSGACIDKTLVATNAIPQELISAQYFLAIEALTQDLQPTKKSTDKGPVSSEAVEGAVSIAYDTRFSVSHSVYEKANEMMKVLYGVVGDRIVRS